MNGKIIASLILFLFLSNGIYGQNRDIETTADSYDNADSGGAIDSETGKAEPASIIKMPLRIIVSYIPKSSVPKSNALIVFGIIVVILYILALILSNKTACVILWGWWDLILVVIPGVILVYYLFNRDNVVKYDTQLNIIFSALTIITMALSVIINIVYSGPKGVFFGIVSILTKLIIMIVAPVMLFLYIMALNSGKSDKRYRDGTKGNTRTMWLAIVSLIAVYLVVNLIKTENEN